MAIEHHWEICMMCGPVVVCGACGNNCCNGGSGDDITAPNGKCSDCPSAYEMQNQPRNGIKYYISKSKIKKEIESFFGGI